MLEMKHSLFIPFTAAIYRYVETLNFQRRQHRVFLNLFFLQMPNSIQQKHPHVIFEARTKQNKGCANSGNLEWRPPRRQQHITGYVDKQDRNGAGRYKRDVRDATKYIETAIIIDKAMFDKRNGSTRAEVVHDAIQVANIADLVSFINNLSCSTKRLISCNHYSTSAHSTHEYLWFILRHGKDKIKLKLTVERILVKR